MSETSDCLLCSYSCVKKLIKNTTRETYCVIYCCFDTPKSLAHAEGGVVSINTDVKSKDTGITDTRNHRHKTRDDIVPIYQQATPLAKIIERKVHHTLEYPRCVGDAEGKNFEDALKLQMSFCDSPYFLLVFASKRLVCCKQ